MVDDGHSMAKLSLDHPRAWLAVIIAAFAGLLPLAWLQYRWIGDLARAEQDRRKSHLESSVARFVQDFDGEVFRVQRALMAGRGEPPFLDLERLAARFHTLAGSGFDPRLIKRLLVSRGGDDGVEELLQFDNDTGAFRPLEWPPELEPLRARLVAASGAPAPGALASLPFDDRVPVLVAPRRQPGGPGGMGPLMRMRRRPRIPAGWAFVVLDLEFITNEHLPDLVRRHFSGAGEAEFQVRIVSRRDAGRLIYTSDAALPDDFFDPPDAAAVLLDVRPGLPGAMFGEPPGDPRFGLGPPGAWRLLVKHRTGSLEAVVEGTRRRNLAVSFGILALMAAGLAVLLLSTRRAQRLARLQMEFVAGVSHELRSPLSVICSAGDNLADGLVAGDQQVRRYGSVVRSEGRRLAGIVDQILGFAGIQSGRAKFEPQPVEPGEVIRRALAACEPDIGAAGCAVEARIADDLPHVWADATSLTHALRNLIDNAVTHGGEGKWVGISARPVESAKGPQVEIAIEDRGPGIDPSELPHIFEPFYRGRRAVRDQAGGFGLGLALASRIIEAHSGALTAESVPGRGTRFVARLPAVPAPAAPEDESHGATDTADRG